MICTKEHIEQLDRITRINIINSVTGIKPANLIGTIDDNGKTNLAIFSSVVHLGSSPALLGFISRPRTEEVGHTFKNIQKNSVYTINHIHPDFIKNAHYTSAKFPQEVSEFEQCNLNEEYITGFEAPFVKESSFKLGMRLKQVIDIDLNGTALVIGEIEHLILPDNSLVDSDIDLEASQSVGISGLSTYYSLKKMESFPYAHINELPEL